METPKIQLPKQTYTRWVPLIIQWQVNAVVVSDLDLGNKHKPGQGYTPVGRSEPLHMLTSIMQVYEEGQYVFVGRCFQQHHK